MTYKPFEDDDTDSGYREAEAYALLLQQQAITDVKVGFRQLAVLTQYSVCTTQAACNAFSV